MEKKARILFMGTPGFAVASLEALYNSNHNIAGIVTSPDKPAGRGRKLKRSAVAEYADKIGFSPLLQPKNLKDPAFIRTINDLKPDIAVVVAFRMLPEVIWKIPAKGTFNLHASLLPQYRGAAPINHAIINGETKTGVTTFLLDKEIDTGNIILREETSIGSDETAGILHDRLMEMGASLVKETISILWAGSVQLTDQSMLITEKEVLKTAPKIFSSDCFINWGGSAEETNNFIRGLSPHPGAKSILKGPQKEFRIKITASGYEISQHKDSPGTIILSEKNSLKVAVNDGYINIMMLQPEGKNLMSAAEFLRGRDLDGFKMAINLQV
ncbi:MAG: methionyl-tRNA formyltransferase [Bacteroidales bacterium]|nr:methionyl-tRNA formyltransferase [Bacteroidales bacterium]